MKNALYTNTFIFTIIIIFSIILISENPTFGMRIDGAFDDWKDVKILASDPEGDANGVFDITRLCATNRISILYLRFDSGNIVNIRNGPKSEGTLMIMIDLPGERQLILSAGGRKAYLNDDLKKKVFRDHLKYVAGLTYARISSKFKLPRNGLISKVIIC